MTTEDMWIGKRVARLRDMKGLTQQRFADAVGVSQQYISAIENGTKPVTKRSLLYALSDALGVPNTELIGQPEPLRTRADLLTYGTVASIRAALDSPDEPVHPRPLTELKRVANALMVARMDCDYLALGAGLAPLIAEARAAADEDSGTHTRGHRRVLVRALVTASLTLKPLGWLDLAMRCAELARHVASQIGDPDAYGAAEFATAQCVLAAGNRRQSFIIAGTAAAALTGQAGYSAMAWQGLCDLHAGFAAASLNMVDDVAGHMERAERLAVLMMDDPWAMEFTTANVWTWRAGAALENGTPEKAPELAARVDRSQLRSRQRRCRLDMDAGRGHYLAGHPEAAVRSFLAANKVAPAELRTRPSVVEIVGQMWRDATPGPSADLRELARVVGVAV